jgi:hypothetical protein
MYSKGVSWIDDCRIPFVDDGDNNTTRGQYENKVQVGIMADRPNIKFVGSFDDSAKQGRFPANLLVSDDMLNDGVITKTSQKNNIVKNTTQMFNYSPQREYPEIQDKGSSSRYYDIDKWFDNLING